MRGEGQGLSGMLGYFKGLLFNHGAMVSICSEQTKPGTSASLPSTLTSVSFLNPQAKTAWKVTWSGTSLLSSHHNLYGSRCGEKEPQTKGLLLLLNLGAAWQMHPNMLWSLKVL